MSPPEPAGLAGRLTRVLATRRDVAGRYVPLAEQDALRWNAATIDAAEALLHQTAGMARPGR